MLFKATSLLKCIFMVFFNVWMAKSDSTPITYHNDDKIHFFENLFSNLWSLSTSPLKFLHGIWNQKRLVHDPLQCLSSKHFTVEVKKRAISQNQNPATTKKNDPVQFKNALRELPSINYKLFLVVNSSQECTVRHSTG